MNEVKPVIDTAAVASGVGSFFSLLPDIAALFTVLWLALRIWEMETIKRLTGRGQ